MDKHIVLYSHGFGMDKTDRGLFTDIAATLSHAESSMVSLNDIDAESGSLLVNPFSVQSAILAAEYAGLRSKNPDATIDLVCHSQGCIVAALLGLSGLRRVVLLTPPYSTAISNTVNRARKDPDSHVDMEGMSRLKRSDGSYTMVPASYWRERTGMDLPSLYNAWAAVQPNITIIHAADDHVLGNVDLSSVKMPAETLAGNHDFAGAARAGLLRRVTELLNE